jgi:hypothetical protein
VGCRKRAFEEVIMLTQLEHASEAVRAAAARLRTLPPALSRCPGCGQARAIASPLLGTCQKCGMSLVVDGEQQPSDHQIAV